VGSVAGPNPSGGALAVPGANSVYVSDLTGNRVDGFTSNGGNLTAIPGSPFSGVIGPTALTSDGRFLFVTNFVGNSVSVFSLGPNGTLTAVPGSPFPGVSGPASAAINLRAPHVLYVSNSTGALGEISGYAVGPNTGALTPLPGSPFPTKPGAGPAGMAVAGAGDILFVALVIDDSVAAFAIDPNSGALTPVPGSPFGAGSLPFDLATTGGSYLYVANGGGNTVSGFVIASNGVLAPIPGSPFATGAGPSHLVVDNFLHLYVSNSGSDNVSGFAINPASGALTSLAGSPYSAGTRPTSLAVGN
jgi:6-phosphogluconolactonase